MPKDPVMLLSYVNTKLRDEYTSLYELCSSENADINEVTRKLNAINYFYNNETNQFV